MMASKPSLLFFGVVGGVTAHLIQHITTNDLASKVRVVSYNLVSTCPFSPEFMEGFSKVECIQANLRNEEAVDRAFKRDDGLSWDYVFYIFEVRTEASDSYSQQKTIEPVSIIGRKAVEYGVKVLVHTSCAFFYEKNEASHRNTEESPVKPTLPVHKTMLAVEDGYKSIKGLNTIAMRMGLLYGTELYSSFLTPLVITRVYHELKEPREVFLPPEAPQQLVHVHDVSRAFWHVAGWRVTAKDQPEHIVFNIAQPVPYDYAKAAKVSEELYNVKTVYIGSFAEKAAKEGIEEDELQDNVNHAILGGWSKLLTDSGIDHSPIVPYVDRYLLDGLTYSIDGSHISKLTGFVYEHEDSTTEDWRQIIRSAQRMRYWPVGDNI